MDQHPFLRRLYSARPLLLDGATGTELQRRGVDTGLPLWSARALLEAPDVLRAIHADYAAAGADILTTNTFRTQRRTLKRAGFESRSHELTQLAVQIAREVAQTSDRPVFVAGSMSPLEDCYSPQLVPSDRELRREHAEMAHDLAEAGCDVLLVETMNTVREAVIAAQCARETGLPVCVSLVVGPNAWPPDQIEPARVSAERILLLSGESIADAVQAIRPIEPAAILINCVPLAYSDQALDELRTATHRQAADSGPIGLYANVGHADDRVGWTLTDDVLPEAYARHAQYWLKQGARIIGGCCGTTPAHIAALGQLIKTVPRQKRDNDD